MPYIYCLCQTRREFVEEATDGYLSCNYECCDATPEELAKEDEFEDESVEIDSPF